ncbi:FAD-linked oxidoreductase apf9 [Fusarium oxysporum f. sp. albedinis]|nr:FAD-linked oxidoreductase apf9 [Fusarium oxysporum f. sp. albedinis]
MDSLTALWLPRSEWIAVPLSVTKPGDKHNRNRGQAAEVCHFHQLRLATSSLFRQREIALSLTRVRW